MSDIPPISSLVKENPPSKVTVSKILSKSPGVSGWANYPTTVSKRCIELEREKSLYFNSGINGMYLLLEDTDAAGAPEHLITLMGQLNFSDLTSAEILLLLVYTVAVECGFTTQREYEEQGSTLERLSPTSTFNVKNARRICSYVPFYEEKNNKSLLSMQLYSMVDVNNLNTANRRSLLTAVITGDLFIVTLTPQMDVKSPGRSVCLSIGRYVLSGFAERQPVYKNFRKLKELSLLLRENIFIPVRNEQLASLGIQIYPSLLGLPTELYDDIFRHLNHQELKIIANVCKELQDAVNYSKFMKNK